MIDKYLDAKLANAGKEHQKISLAIIKNDIAYLNSNYGSLKNANDRLYELEYFLNHREWK